MGISLWDIHVPSTPRCTTFPPRAFLINSELTVIQDDMFCPIRETNPRSWKSRHCCSTPGLHAVLSVVLVAVVSFAGQP